MLRMGPVAITAFGVVAALAMFLFIPTAANEPIVPHDREAVRTIHHSDGELSDEKWEYRVVPWPLQESVAENDIESREKAATALQHELNRYGDEGWELVAERDGLLIYKQPVQMNVCNYVLEYYDAGNLFAVWETEHSYWQRSDGGVMARGVSGTLRILDESYEVYDPTASGSSPFHLNSSWVSNQVTTQVQFTNRRPGYEMHVTVKETSTGAQRERSAYQMDHGHRVRYLSGGTCELVDIW